MVNAEEAQAILRFLDRVQIQGHGERDAMNVIYSKLVTGIRAAQQENPPEGGQTPPKEKNKK